MITRKAPKLSQQKYVKKSILNKNYLTRQNPYPPFTAIFQTPWVKVQGPCAHRIAYNLGIEANINWRKLTLFLIRKMSWMKLNNFCFLRDRIYIALWSRCTIRPKMTRMWVTEDTEERIRNIHLRLTMQDDLIFHIAYTINWHDGHSIISYFRLV